ncbi:MAG: hypothetical protein AB2N28_1930 [Candidatus Phytoplasma solani]
MLPKKSHKNDQNKKIYFFVMSLGVILVLCLICLFCYTNMFQVEYINGKYGKTNYWGLLFQITLYWFILKTLHDLFKKQKQEEKFFLPSWSRLSPLSAVFNHQLSNNPKIRVQQEKLIKQKKIFK